MAQSWKWTMTAFCWHCQRKGFRQMTTANNYDARLAELGLTLPVPAVPIANFVPCVQVGNTLYVSGQVPRENGQLAFAGKVGPVDVGLKGDVRAIDVAALAGHQRVNERVASGQRRVDGLELPDVEHDAGVVGLNRLPVGRQHLMGLAEIAGQCFAQEAGRADDENLHERLRNQSAVVSCAAGGAGASFAAPRQRLRI